MSQEQLALLLHFENKGTISSYETDRRTVPSDVVIRLAEIFQTTTCAGTRHTGGDGCASVYQKQCGKKCCPSADQNTCRIRKRTTTVIRTREAALRFWKCPRQIGSRTEAYDKIREKVVALTTRHVDVVGSGNE